MLTSVLKFLKGYVVVHLSGYSPERFLNLCCHHKIVLWGLRSTGTEYEMCMSIAAFRKVRPLVRKTQTKVVILERHGLPFLLWKYRRRKLFAAGAFFCIVLLYVMSLFIWNIHIEGNESLSTQVVLSYLKEEGITHGMLKRQIHGEELEKKLREHFTEVTWTSAEVKGTRLIVHMKENEDASFSLVDEKEPADLVAAKSGQIISMIVRAGTPVVHEGDQVQAGDLLVKSQVEVMNDEGMVAQTHLVHADAYVKIQYRQSYEASFPMDYVKKEYTGRRKRALYLILGNRRITVGVTKVDYEYQDLLTSEVPLRITENFYLPVTVGIRTIKEYIPREAIYTEQEAKQRAEQELQLFFEKIKIKGLQIIENGVKIEVNGQVCTARGSLLVEEEAVRTQKPVIEIQEENDQHLEEEREQT